jgi:hypothetical protein
MQPTFEEEINHTIFEFFKCNDTDNNIIDWFNKYGSICDEIIKDIYNTKGIQFLNDKQKEVWSLTSKDMRMRLYEIIKLSNNKNNIIQNLKNIIPIRKKLIKEFRQARDNNTARMLSTFASDFSDIPINWSFSTIEEKERAKTCWISLAKLSIQINNTVSFLDSTSPEYWKKITNEWMNEIK